IAGAPANNRTHIHTGFLWNLKATNSTAGARLPAEKIAWITKAVVSACAGKDGGSPEDAFLTDPRECKFNPDTLPKCHANDQNDCLTGAQLAALKLIYAGPTNPKTGERIYTPIPLGSENSLAGVLQQENPAKMAAQFYPFQWALGAKFDYTKFDYDQDQDKVDRKLAPILNANNPDLSKIKKMGGKIVMFTGTADPLVPYQDALNYYDRVIDNQQSKLAHSGENARQQALTQTQDFFRYFLIPGMAHCGGGPGLHDFGQSLGLNVPTDSEHDLLTALIGWVEQGKAPDEVIATTFVDDKPAKGIEFQRPICAYPKFPNYMGGDRKAASSYRCVDHPRGEVPKPAKRYLN
ncbi:MAG TPA: tannase/feruloyl esterase family alpha/beta hydrolase, partial [Acidobacteriaceae bacterium]|nr:tannase/feruloyl esterase family alpha/beta hydrolase [Acidobacteriaceae bacterium]